jgi:hypothetical protein
VGYVPYYDTTTTIAGSQYIRVDSTGYVSIGNIVPNSASLLTINAGSPAVAALKFTTQTIKSSLGVGELDFNGTAGLRFNAPSIFNIDNGSASVPSFRIGTATTPPGFYADASSNLYFATNGTLRLTINSTGTLIIAGLTGAAQSMLAVATDGTVQKAGALVDLCPLGNIGTVNITNATASIISGTVNGNQTFIANTFVNSKTIGFEIFGTVNTGAVTGTITFTMKLAGGSAMTLATLTTLVSQSGVPFKIKGQIKVISVSGNTATIVIYTEAMFAAVVLAVARNSTTLNLTNTCLVELLAVSSDATISGVVEDINFKQLT